MDHAPVLVELFRTKYGEILAVLLRSTGYAHFDVAEEAVQTAFQRALEKWPQSGIPENAAGWLYTVARNALNETLRRRNVEATKLAQLPRAEVAEADTLALDSDNVEALATPHLDDLATMILLCCNPELSPKAQVSLTLKAACGFSVREIARALGMQEEATKKMITRAKAQVAADPQALHLLNANRITERFGLVLATLYALFLEGYAASSGATQLRRDVAQEAVRLTDLLLHASFTPDARHGELQALLALMLLQLARFEARRGASGIPVRLQEQDRAQWNPVLIRAGMAALEASTVSPVPTTFHIEARIAAEHALAPTFAATKWPRILALYDQLLLLKATPEVRLNRIVALRYAAGWQVALAELDRIERTEVNTVARSFLLHAIRADLLEAAGRADEAARAWAAAQSQAPTTADRDFVATRLKNLSA